MHDGGGGAAAPAFPADGPVEAALGYALVYVVVDRATPAVVEVVAGAVPGVSAPLVGLGLAAALWFVLAVTAVDQLRRQLSALGIVADWGSPGLWARLAPPGTRPSVFLVVLVVGGAVAAWTFGDALAAAVTAIRAVAALDPSLLRVGEALLLVSFFVSYGAAAHAADRLVFGGIRRLRAG